MSDKRQKLITKLEALREYVNNPNIIKSESLREDLKKQIEASINHTRFGRYHVTTLGAFSTGKSTLLNAILGANYLPSNKLPTTAITTELYFDNCTSFFIKFDDTEKESFKQIKLDVERSLKALFPNQEIRFIDKIDRDGNSFAGVGGIITNSNLDRQKKADFLSKVLSELTDQLKRKSVFFSSLKNELNSNTDLTLWVAIDSLSEWLKDIVLTDVPGAGSINSKHEIIINKIIPDSQLILYLLDYDKLGSSIDAELCGKISNSYHRKVFYIINKYDRGDVNDFDITVDKAKEFIPKCNDENIKPEFYKLSALYYLTFTTLQNNIITKRDVVNNNDINLTKLLLSDEFNEIRGKEPEETNLITKYLKEKSFFANIQKRIEQYLREENKTEAIFYQGLSLFVIDLFSCLTHITRAFIKPTLFLSSSIIFYIFHLKI